MLFRSYPDALAEKVVSQKELNEKTLKLHVGEQVDSTFIVEVLRSYGFEFVDYVYEPGQFAVRGSIIDIFSYSSEYPYRIDFFGDEVESIRTFEVDSQLSKDKVNEIFLVPNLSKAQQFGISFTKFIDKDVILGVKDLLWIAERVDSIATEEVSEQLLISEAGDLDVMKKVVDPKEFSQDLLNFKRIEFGSKPHSKDPVKIEFHTSLQPTFQKNFDLTAKAFREYLIKGYTLYILSDSQKQIERIKHIFEDRKDDIPFIPVLKTIHEGFADDDMKKCYFTDHQLFDRYHKYNLKSDKARSGKIALSLKELNQIEEIGRAHV